LVGLLFALSWAGAQELRPAERSVSYWLEPVGGSGVSGVVHIADHRDYTVVVVALQGTPAGGSHPAHFHAGECGSGGGIVVPLENVDGDTGLSVTVTKASYDAIVGGNHYLNVHASAADLGTIVACGEVGEGATSAHESGMREAPTPHEPMTTPAPPEEFEASIRTAGFGIFAVEGSGVSGQIQFTERVEGGTRVTVALDGIDRQQRYPVAIFRGDCGPDREHLLDLDPVPFAPGETSSVTDTELDFETLAEEDNFVYVYAPDGETVVACGEVGAGAVR
jgi:hypothetical protein